MVAKNWQEHNIPLLNHVVIAHIRISKLNE